MSFQIGDIVKGDDIFILVTGKGKKVKGYSTFPGVVAKLSNAWNSHRVGFYCDAWDASRFKLDKTGLIQVIKVNGVLLNKKKLN